MGVAGKHRARHMAGDAHNNFVAGARLRQFCDQRVTLMAPAPMGATTKQVGSQGTKQHCDTLLRDATSVRQMTRADLTEEVCQALETPRKTTSSFAPYLTASSEPCNPGTRLKSADSEASTRANAARASDAIQKPEPASKCRRKEFPFSSRARNFANWLMKSDLDCVCSTGTGTGVPTARRVGQRKGPGPKQ